MPKQQVRDIGQPIFKLANTLLPLVLVIGFPSNAIGQNWVGAIILANKKLSIEARLSGKAAWFSTNKVKQKISFGF
jgi:hypothetical protein